MFIERKTTIHAFKFAKVSVFFYSLTFTVEWIRSRENPLVYIVTVEGSKLMVRVYEKMLLLIIKYSVSQIKSFAQKAKSLIKQ